MTQQRTGLSAEDEELLGGMLYKLGVTMRVQGLNRDDIFKPRESEKGGKYKKVVSQADTRALLDGPCPRSGRDAATGEKEEVEEEVKVR